MPALYLALFGLGVIATLYSPVKYGILPDHLRRDELTLANALVEGATFIAILLGLAAGGMTGLETTSKWHVLVQLFGVSLACLVTTWFIPATEVAAPEPADQPQPLRPPPSACCAPSSSIRGSGSAASAAAGSG